MENRGDIGEDHQRLKGEAECRGHLGCTTVEILILTVETEIESKGWLCSKGGS